MYSLSVCKDGRAHYEIVHLLNDITGKPHSQLYCCDNRWYNRNGSVGLIGLLQCFYSRPTGQRVACTNYGSYFFFFCLLVFVLFSILIFSFFLSCRFFSVIFLFPFLFFIPRFCYLHDLLINNLLNSLLMFFLFVSSLIHP